MPPSKILSINFDPCKKDISRLTRKPRWLLKNAGLNEPALFSYYAIGDALQLKPTADNGLFFVLTAYTATEFTDIMPGRLNVDQNTWRAAERHCNHPKKTKLTCPYTHPTLVKNPGGSYVAAYYHFNCNIAFRKTDKGKFANLLLLAGTPAE